MRTPIQPLQETRQTLSSTADSISLTSEETTSANKAREWYQRAAADLGETYLRWKQARDEYDRMTEELERAERVVHDSEKQYVGIMKVIADNYDVAEGDWAIEGDQLVRKD